MLEDGDTRLEFDPTEDFRFSFDPGGEPKMEWESMLEVDTFSLRPHQESIEEIVCTATSTSSGFEVIVPSSLNTRNLGAFVMHSLVFKLHLQHSPSPESLMEETRGDLGLWPVGQLCPVCHVSSRWQPEAALPDSCSSAGELGIRSLNTGLLTPPPSDNCEPEGLCSSSVTSSARHPSDATTASAKLTDDGIAEGNVKEGKLFSRMPSSFALVSWRRSGELDGEGEEVLACRGDGVGEDTSKSFC